MNKDADFGVLYVAHDYEEDTKLSGNDAAVAKVNMLRLGFRERGREGADAFGDQLKSIGERLGKLLAEHASFGTN